MLDISDIGYYRIEEAFISRYDKSGDSFNIANMIASISFTGEHLQSSIDWKSVYK